MVQHCLRFGGDALFSFFRGIAYGEKKHFTFRALQGACLRLGRDMLVVRPPINKGSKAPSILFLSIYPDLPR